MNYGDLIKDAVGICWRNKFLWLFGFFVGGTGAFFHTYWTLACMRLTTPPAPPAASEPA